ncbi:MAG: SAM-dependent methyltransferase [Moraxellaceae bacterium]|nr:MAG: SAM-dependent methyltransferase [Moraxellaceae bacterium]
MGFYEDYCLPYIVDKACGAAPAQEHRRKIVPMAEGRVLEVGMGSGHNLPFYDASKVDFVWGLEPSIGMRRRAKKNISQTPIEVRWLDLPGEQIPLEDNSVDTVLMTYTLCTIPDWQLALQQMRRVLRPGGKLIFSEHGAAPDASVLKWQNRITPYWKILGGGCHLNRPISQYIEDAGFNITLLETEYTRSTPKIAGFNYRGLAKIS